MNGVTPIQFLAEHDPRESFVYRLFYSATERTLELVYAYAAAAVSASFDEMLSGTPGRHRDTVDIRRIVFFDVVAVVCTGRDWPGYGYMSNREWPKQSTVSWDCVITDIGFEAEADKLLAHLKMQQYGPYLWQFSSLRSDREQYRFIRKDQDGGWAYFDINRGIEVKEIRPFGV